MSVVDRLIYFPSRYPEGLWELQPELRAADVWLDTSDGIRIHAWWIPSAGGRLATVFFHGNAGNLTHRIGHMRAIPAAGSSLLIVDYRGYGRSAGRPSEQGVYKDAEAAYEWLLDRGYGAKRIVIHGESLGTAVAVDLAARRESGGVILEMPFNSASRVAAGILPFFGPLCVRCFDSKRKIDKIRAPLLFIHGDRDEVIPYKLGRDLYDAAPQPKSFWTIDGAGHNDLLDVAGPRYRERLAAFYASLHPE